MEQVSALSHFEMPLKCEDTGYPTILYMIVQYNIEKALLDLGADINLLPYPVYK